jgi:hypothetical protein
MAEDYLEKNKGEEFGDEYQKIPYKMKEYLERFEQFPIGICLDPLYGNSNIYNSQSYPTEYLERYQKLV